jgi:hypothetical protein
MAARHVEEPVPFTVQAIAPSSQTEMDQALTVLTAHKDEWAMLDIPTRIALLDQIKQGLSNVETRWVTASMAAKDTRAETMGESEEWWSLILVYRYLRILRKALQDIAQFGKPQIPGKVTRRPNGQVIAQVVPSEWKDQFAIPGVRAEVWMDPSVSIQAKYRHHFIIVKTGRKHSAWYWAGNMHALAVEEHLLSYSGRQCCCLK